MLENSPCNPQKGTVIVTWNVPYNMSLFIETFSQLYLKCLEEHVKFTVAYSKKFLITTGSKLASFAGQSWFETTVI